MHDTIRSLVDARVLWRALIAAAVIGVRVMLDAMVPRGRIGRRAAPVWTKRR